MPSMKSLLWPACLALALNACSKVDDMHDSTVHMDKTTSALGQTSDEMNAAMQQILDTGRQGAALDVRNKQFQLVLDSRELEEKGTNAEIFFIGFEFQLWNNVGLDKLPGEREKLMNDAADEFFGHIAGLTHWDTLSPFAGKNPIDYFSYDNFVTLGRAENEQAVFNALAAAMEKNNRKVDLTQTDQSDAAYSMRNMIETALRANKEINDGRAKISDYPQYVQTIIKQPHNRALRLMKARYQMLGLVVLGQLSKFTQNTVEGFRYLYLGRQWNLDLNELNDSNMALASFRLKEAIRARDFLKEIGEPEELDPRTQKIYRKMKVHTYSAKAVGVNQAAYQAATQELVESLNDYAGQAVEIDASEPAAQE